MPLVAHPVTGQIIASAWGTLVADQVVTTFPTASARSSGLPSPKVGQLSTLDNVPGRLDIWTGTTWDPVASAAATSWTTYTPTWAAGGSTAGLAIGTAGTLLGRYKMIAPYTLAAAVNFQAGTSGFNGGTGQWTFSLPAGYTLGGPVVASHALIAGGNPNIGNTSVGSTSLMAPASIGAGGLFNWWSATFPYNPWTPAYAGAAGVIVGVNQRW